MLYRFAARPASLFIALFVAATLTPAVSSAGFVQTLTCTDSGMYRCNPGESPLPVQWPRLSVSYYINERGAASIPTGPDGLISAELEGAIVESFEAWNRPECSEFNMTYEGLTSREEVGYPPPAESSDGSLNLVVWRDDEWPYGSFTAVALTTVTFVPSTGYIVDADIELNGALYVFTNTDDPAQTVVDVRNTMTHEVGHFLGLDHSPNPLATMYSTAPEGELSKRHLHQDDIDGLCHIYPLGTPEEAVAPPPEDKGICAAAAPTAPARTPVAMLAACGLAALVLARRRILR